MKIVYAKPPVYDRIVKALGEPPAGAIYTYGDTIFVPSGKTPPGDLQEHERIHSDQQVLWSVNGWWDKYLKDPAWRVEQELEAYKAQFEFVKSRTRDKAKRGWALENMARSMASPMYGSVIKYIDAWKEIGGYA